MAVYFLELHAMAPPVSVMTYPLIDFRSAWDAQLASQYIFISSIPLSFPSYCSPTSLVPFRYWNTLLMAVQCHVFGLRVNCASQFDVNEMSGRAMVAKWSSFPIKEEYVYVT